MAADNNNIEWSEISPHQHEIMALLKPSAGVQEAPPLKRAPYMSKRVPYMACDSIALVQPSVGAPEAPTLKIIRGTNSQNHSIYTRARTHTQTERERGRERERERT